MGNYRPYCVATNGERFFLASLLPLYDWSYTTDPALSAFKRRIILLRSQPYPPSLNATIWTVVDSSPSSSSSAQTNDLDSLIGDFTSGSSNCQVDAQGNFVWISAKSAAKNPTDPSTPIIATTPAGIQYSVSSVAGPGIGVWSPINLSRLQGGNYVWNNDGKVNVLFSIAQDVVVHALASTTLQGLVLGVLTGDNFVQSNQTWPLDANIYGIPKAIAYGNHTLYVLGSNKVLSLWPVSTTARDVASLLAYQQTLAPAAVQQFSLTTLSDECVNSQSTSLYSTVVGNTFYLLCAGVSFSTPLRVFTFDGALLQGPNRLPILNGQSNISSFSAISGSSDVLLLSMSDNLFGMTSGTGGFKLDTTSYIVGDDTSPTNVSIVSPSPTYDPSTSGSGSSSNPVGGVVGSIAAICCIIGLVYCRFVRRKRVKAKIERIIRRHDGPHIVSPDTFWTAGAQHSTVMPPPLQSQQHQQQQLQQHQPQQPLANYNPIATEEQHDLAQIELQRLRLGPAPAIVALGATGGVAPPRAPPSITVSDDISLMPPPSSYSPFSHAANMTSATAPPHNQYPYQQQHQQHLQDQTYAHHLAHQSQEVLLGEDYYSQDAHPDSPSGSSTGLISASLGEKASMRSEYHGSNSMSQSSLSPYHAPPSAPSSSSAATETSSLPTSTTTTRYPPSQGEKKAMTAQEEEDDRTIRSPPPPPPPYLAKATQLLNSPSAPSPEDHRRYL